MSNTSKLTKYFAVFVIMLSLFFTLPVEGAFAQTTNTKDENKIVEILCNATGVITGGAGKAIAVLIIVSLAISLFLGKVSWGMAIAVAVGMGILFGAEDMVGLISGDATGICDPYQT